MPQLKPLRWISLLSWSFTILALAIAYNQSIAFPNTLRIQLSRLLTLFN